MNRRGKRALERRNTPHRHKEQNPPKWLVATSLFVGLIAGLCIWYFVSRCENRDCFFHYYPFAEVFCLLILFWAIPYVLFSGDE